MLRYLSAAALAAAVLSLSGAGRCAAHAAVSAAPRAKDGAEKTPFIHRNGRVAANLPPAGMLGGCENDGIALGIRWPGVDGMEMLGRGGFVLRVTFAGKEEQRSVGPSDFLAVPAGNAGIKLFEGCPAGRRYPAPDSDDDGDGLTDEDPFDGLDNDGDGSVDEDFAAIGHGMVVTRASVPGLDISLSQSSYVWSFGHLRDFIGFTSKIGRDAKAGERGREIAGIEIAHFVDFKIGDGEDAGRGDDDRFFFMRATGASDASSAEEMRGRDGAETGILFAVATDRPSAGSPYAAVVILDVTSNVPFEMEDGAAIAPAPADTSAEASAVWEALDARTGAGPGDGNSGYGRRSPGDARGMTAEGREYFPAGDLFLKTAPATGDLMAARKLATLPDLNPGGEILVEWAIVFGRTEETLARNVMSAIETYRGAGDEKGGINRWIAPARKAAIVKVASRLVPVWIQGVRKAAVSAELPSKADEDVEWLKVAGKQIDDFELIDGRVIAVIGDAAAGGEMFSIEGQLSDGTIFRSDMDAEKMASFTGEDSISPDRLPEECLRVFPNPFVTGLNINLDARGWNGSGGAQAGPGSGIASSVRIYDVKGRLVRTVLREESRPAGDYSAGWDGNGEDGTKVRPGVYYCKLQIGDRSVTRRVILLK